MHLLAAQPGAIGDGSEAVDLGQTPGDIVVLSAADSELALLAAARELETIERAQEATGLYRTILVDHATSQVATEAERRLKALVGRDDM